MKKFLAIGLVLVLGGAGAAIAVDGPEPPEGGVTPYGAYCPLCTTYGAGRHQVTHTDAVAAIAGYFGARGYAIGNVDGEGRFLQVDILDGSRVVDRIIFDKRTGRIRSVY